MLKRRKNQPNATAPADSASEEPVSGPDTPTSSPARRSHGPWDSSERDVDTDPTFLDLGSMIIHGRVGIDIQLPTEGDSDITGAVVMMTEDSGLEMRAFASTRSGGMWDEVRAELLADVERRSGEAKEVEGLFGAELHVRLPMELPDGEAGVQPSRIIGIEGPRWFLRATFLGMAAAEPSDEGLLMECLCDTIIKRGSAPMAPREPLILTVPSGPVVADDSQA